MTTEETTVGWIADPCPHCGARVETMTTGAHYEEVEGERVQVTQGVWMLLPCGHRVDHVSLDHNTGRATYTSGRSAG